MKKPRQPPDDRPQGLTHNPFAALKAGTGESGSGDEGRQESDGSGVAAGDEPVQPPDPGATVGTRLVVRREKRGRGGKTVTRVNGFELEESALVSVAREMKRALGCGASVEGADVLLQGAQTERAAAWLRARFDAKVTIGN